MINLVDERFVVDIKGKKFVTFEGLLNEFHQNGGKSINTEVVSTSPLIIKATASGEKGTFSGIGDADESNVNKMIAVHKIRMAETRAIARALRWYNNIGMCSTDEMGGQDNTPTGTTKEDSHVPEMVRTKDEIKDLKCNLCAIKITEKVADFSNRTYGQNLCFNCQTKAKEQEAKQEGK